jgi:hypothetical protein
LLLVGCEAPDLPRHFVINDASWGPSAPARVRLAPGDVLYLSTWIHGSVTPIPNNDYPPIISTERLPLRVVDGPLLPLESGLLGSVLATHRTNVVATPVLAKALDREQAALWDALVTSLRLVKASPRVPMQVQLDEGQFCRAFAGTKPGPVRTLILTSYFRYADGTCTAVGTTDLRKIPQLETALAPLTETNTGMHGGFYRDGNKTVAVSRVEAEIAGASMRNRGGMEARWSLAEWEAARICKDGDGQDLAISYLELGQFQYRALRVVAPDQPAEIQILPDEARGRAVIQNPDLRGAGTLSQTSLRWLYPADATRVIWGATEWSLDRRLRLTCTLD